MSVLVSFTFLVPLAFFFEITVFFLVVVFVASPVSVVVFVVLVEDVLLLVVLSCANALVAKPKVQITTPIPVITKCLNFMMLSFWG